MNDPKRPRTDLRYGILLRNLHEDCDTLIARVFDVGGNSVTSAPIFVPNQTATNEFVDFEDGAMPPAGWKRVTSTTGSGTTVANDPSAYHSGSRGMRCVDASTTETTTQRAGIEFALPAGRFEWIAEGWFNPTVLHLAPKNSLHLIQFLSGEDFSVAARIRRHEGGLLLAGIVAKDLDGKFKPANSSAIISPAVWRRWRLHVLRIATRESTAVLSLNEVNEDDKMKEQARLNWDATAADPTVLRTGIGLLSAGAEATVLTDDLRVSESSIS